MRIVNHNPIKSPFFLHSFEIIKAIRIFLLLAGVIAVVSCSHAQSEETPFDRAELQFDGDRAYANVQTQVNFGPRIPGSAAHRITGDWIASQMRTSGWDIEFQEFQYGGYELRNIIARAPGSELSNESIILGAHYDTRLFADLDEERPYDPVPGANDGASGVAVLIELARVLELDSIQNSIWFVFFDAEDNGRIAGWDWILGSRYFVEEMDVKPEAAVIIDMVGDSDLKLYFERNSDPQLRQEIWSAAENLDFEEFISQEKYSILDDHTPFLQAGIPAVDIIDFDYEFFHTTEDLPDKVSAESLFTVGRTLEHWLEMAN
ncbi:MAG: M28 family peptidase [Anaerolineales bacterium]|jgi:hypothetical protein